MTEKLEEPPSHVRSIFLDWLRTGFSNLPIHQVYVPGKGIMGGQFKCGDFDIEHICFKQNFNREKFNGGDNVF